METPSITFDQPLWLKATGIIEEANLKIVCRLGGFHTMMSFLGSLGGMMRGSGLEDLFNEVYAEHSVPQLMSGKAVSCALCAHFLTEAALTSILLQLLLEEGSIDEEMLKALSEGCCKVQNQQEIDELVDSHVYQKVSDALSSLENSLR